MGIFRQFPYTNFHEINLDWLLTKIKELWIGVEDLDDKIDNFIAETEPTIRDEVNKWLDDHPEATTTVEDNSLTIEKFTDDLKKLTVNGYITFEDFGAAGDGVTDDTEAVQLAYDHLNDTGGTIIAIGKYLITQDILIKRHSNINTPTTVIGLGKNAGFICNATFKGIANDYGHIRFFNIKFESTLTTSTVFTCDRSLIRVLCDLCVFDGITNVCLSSDVTQTMYFTNCVIRDCDYLINGSNSNTRLYDFKMYGCLMEKSGHCLYLPESPSYGTVITNNCIEGLSGVVGTFGIVRTLVISNNYFEKNAMDGTHYIIFNNNNTSNAIIEGNNIVEPDERYLVKLCNNVDYPRSIKIINNNVADYTTPFNFFTALSGGQKYTGLIFEGNNKIPDARLGTPISTIENNAQSSFTIDLPDTTYENITDVTREVAQYAKDNYKERCLFTAKRNTSHAINGMVFANKNVNRIYVLLFDTATWRIGVKAYVYSTMSDVGVYHYVSTVI